MEKKQQKINTHERQIKQGLIAGKTSKENLGFPNYFIAQKSRSKISQHDEKFGKKLFFGAGKKKAKEAKKK